MCLISRSGLINESPESDGDDNVLTLQTIVSVYRARVV